MAGRRQQVWVLLGQARVPQLNLNFTDLPIPETCLWEQFDDAQKQIVIDILVQSSHESNAGRPTGADR